MRYLFERLIRVGSLDPMPLANLMLKLQEEVGELSEAVNHQEGYLPNKEMKEPIAGEIADVINTAVGVLVHAYPELSHEQIYSLLAEQLEKKTDKWEDVIAKRKALKR